MSLTFEAIVSELDDLHSDVAVYRLIPYPADYTAELLHMKWLSGELRIPDFQRRYVWRQQQASRLIESFLLGLPVPGIFLYRDKESQQLLVIDGQQRLMSLFGFFDGYFPATNQPFPLTKVRSQWEGKTYHEISNRDQLMIRDAVLRATIIEQVDPDDDSSIFHIFERLNTGGTMLNPQEIRHCLYRGEFTTLIDDLNNRTSWRLILGTDRPDPRMRDVELVVRFLALSMIAEQYTKPMKEFLSRFMRTLNRTASQSTLNEAEARFAATSDAVVESLGQKPFHIKRGLNAAAFDSVMVAYYRNGGEAPPRAKERFIELLDTLAYQRAISSATTDVDSVRERIALAEQIMFR